MIKAFMAAMRYRTLLPLAIDFVVFVQKEAANGKLSKSARHSIMSYMWDIVKETERVNGAGVTKSGPPVKSDRGKA